MVYIYIYIIHVHVHVRMKLTHTDPYTLYIERLRRFHRYQQRDRNTDRELARHALSTHYALHAMV